jgi:hypothetical protein
MAPAYQNKANRESSHNKTKNNIEPQESGLGEKQNNQKPKTCHRNPTPILKDG